MTISPRWGSVSTDWYLRNLPWGGDIVNVRLTWNINEFTIFLIIRSLKNPPHVWIHLTDNAKRPAIGDKVCGEKPFTTHFNRFCLNNLLVFYVNNLNRSVSASPPWKQKTPIFSKHRLLKWPNLLIWTIVSPAVGRIWFSSHCFPSQGGEEVQRSQEGLRGTVRNPAWCTSDPFHRLVEKAAAARWNRLSVCVPDLSTRQLFSSSSCGWKLCRAPLFMEANEGRSQHNQRCGQIMEDVITAASSSYRWRVPVLIGWIQHRDRRRGGRQNGGKKTNHGNKQLVCLASSQGCRMRHTGE